MKKCVIYCRQSAGSEEYSESVELQKSKCMDLAKKEGLDVIGVYDDLNTSGKTYPTGSEDIASLDIAFQKWYKEQTTKKMYREGLGNVMKSLMEIDYILCYDITRLYRPVTGSFLESHINQLLVIHNVKVMTVNNGIIDMGNFSDSLIMALQNRINHEQIAIQRKKAKEAFKNLKNEGKFKVGLSRMYGFQSTGRKREVEVNPREAEMVKDVYRTFLETSSLLTTTRLINQKYPDLFPTPVYEMNFRRILERPTYCGYMYNTEGELIKNHQVDGLEFISFEDWKEVKTRLDKRKFTHPRAKQGWYPLSGIIYCGVCGSKMKIQKSRTEHFYHCKKHQHSGEKPCHSAIHSTKENEYGIGLIEVVYPLLSIAAVKRLELSLKREESLKELKQLEIQLQNINEKESKITEMFMAELINPSTYESSLQTMKKKKHDLELEIMKIKTICGGESDFEKHLELLKRISNRNLTHTEFESLLNESIKRINLTENQVEIITFYGSVIIPRQKLFHNYNLFPHYWFSMASKKGSGKDYQMNLIFYRGTKEEHPDVWTKRNLIADLGRLKVWIRK